MKAAFIPYLIFFTLEPCGQGSLRILEKDFRDTPDKKKEKGRGEEERRRGGGRRPWDPGGPALLGQ